MKLDFHTVASYNCTPVIEFSIGSIESLDHIIPGSEIILNISVIDELYQTHEHDVVYKAFITSDSTGPSNSNIVAIDSAYSQV